jgi:ATP-binding cassette subfamily B multidrug efflux pump
MICKLEKMVERLMVKTSGIDQTTSKDSLASTGNIRGEELFGSVFNVNVISRFIEFVTPYRKTIYIASFAVLVYTLTQIAIPLIIRDAIDNTVGKGKDEYASLILTVQIFFGIVTLNYISNYFQLTIVAKLAERVMIDLRRAMYVHLQKVSLSFMDKTEVGRLMSRLQGDVNSIQEFLETSIFAIGDFILLIGIIVVLLALDWHLGLLTLSVVPALFFVRMVWLPIAKKAFIRARETSSIVNGALAENISGVRTVQEMARQGINFEQFDEKADDNLRAHLKAIKLSQIMVPTVDTLTGSAMAIVIIVGGNLVLKGTLDLGVMVAFLFFVQRFFDPIRSLTMQYSVMQRAMASGQRIFEVLDVKVEVEDKPDARPLGNTDGSVVFENVTFGYFPNQPVLKNVSFRVNPGETVALVGPTGSGKTSTAALLHRFYDIWEGEISIGGKNIRDVTQESLGETVAMVLQEPFLFTGTVFENIRYNKVSATLEEIKAASKAVGAHDFIEDLANGYNTILGQRGGSLSVGQRQLISFARAIVADAKILVLDEATANIDSFTERQIQVALAVMLKGRTGIVIAHRLATVRSADRIIVLQEGEIVESGNHDELMAMKGMYRHLYSLNYASFDDVSDDLVSKDSFNFRS